MLRILFEENFAATVTILFLILFVVTSSSFEKKVNALFLKASCYVLILIFVEALENICAADTEPSLIRVILSAIGYTLRPAILLYFLKILCRDNNKKSLFVFNILLIINMLIVFSATFTDIAFSYDANNEFVRGPLGISPFIVSGIYVIFILYYTLQRNGNNSSREYLITFAMAITSVIGTFLESVYKLNTILTSCFAISLTFYYMFFHSITNNHDPLTGVLVRRRFYLDADKFSDTLTALISLDLNDLKLLNDKRGHNAGDIALITITKTIQNILPKRSYIYRTGGDEFMILCNKLSTDMVMQFIEDIRNEMSKTPYSCAIGYAFNNKYVSIDQLCLLADETMYKDKIRIKGPEFAAKYTKSNIRQTER